MVGFKRKREIDLSDLPWMQDNAAVALDEDLEKTRKLLVCFAEDPKRVKASIVNSANCPQFPDSEWTNIIAGQAVNLDHVFSSMYSVSINTKRKERIGSIEFTVDAIAPGKTVRSHGDWVIAWERTHSATAFVFPHRMSELFAYGAHVSQFFTVLGTSHHERVIAFDKAVRIRVAERRDIRLNQAQHFVDLQTLWLLNLGTGASDLSSRPHFGRGNPTRPRKRDPCQRWNEGRCPNSTADCNYVHICGKCRSSAHITSACTVSLIWHPEDDYHSHTPAADWSLTAVPLPSPPQNELDNVAANETIAKYPHLFKIVSPINVDKFEELLQTHPNQPFVKSVCRGLHEGFWPSADTSDPQYPQTWDNSKRVLASAEHRAFVEEQCRKEIEVGRFSDAWEADELYPGVYSMPIGVVPKPNSDKLHLVTDHSAGKFSLNSMIGKPAPDEKVQLDNIYDLGHNLLQVRRLLPNIELDIFKSDVAEAYRLMPMHPLWQVKQVVSIGRRRMVDRCNVFSGRRSGNIWCAFMSLVLWIAVYVKHILDLLGYSDDTFSWEYRDNTVWYHPYNRLIPRKQRQLLYLWDELGIPHRSEKQIFGSPLPVIGFEVDPNAMMVSISEERCTALVAGIKDFVESTTHRQRRPLRHFQSLAGWIQWSFNVFPLLRPGLSLLYHKIRGKQHAHALVEISIALRNELLWLVDHVERSSGVLMLRSLAWTYDSADLIIYTDASFLGMGFWAPQIQLAFQSRLPTVVGTIFFWECLTVVAAIHWAASNQHVPTPLRLLIYCDNSNTVDLFNTMHAQPQYNPLL
ncbi:hypothetical protein EVG20_g9737 [Dentipellis fragilis]|uniref:C3H1-type domain-containing protein n=1 Tax=Dentipellis fragilis TaxID=205917 RepID=A0A4Y9XW43_9AGAM|nr:hypothetical protein EVG20_g9737 [Dentipellis fragilis]